jgi:hypothetical protein
MTRWQGDDLNFRERLWRGGCRPFRAKICLGGRVPRALPWADEFEALRAGTAPATHRSICFARQRRNHYNTAHSGRTPGNPTTRLIPRAKGATTLQPRATPWETRPNKTDYVLKGRNSAARLPPMGLTCRFAHAICAGSPVPAFSRNASAKLQCPTNRGERALTCPGKQRLVPKIARFGATDCIWPTDRCGLMSRS